MPAAQQDDIVTGTRELVRQVSRHSRVVGRDDCIGPVGRNMVHEQAAEIRLLINDHDLDTHRTMIVAVNGRSYKRPFRNARACNPCLQRNDLGVLLLVLFTGLLGRIVAALLEFIQVLCRDIAGYVFPGEARRVEFGNR